MSTITTRAGKGSPLTNTEVDANFTNLNADKAELSGATFTGEITASGGIALGDNDKATFGASDDLQIFHSGTNSHVKDAGTGSLLLQGDSLYLSNAAGNLTYFYGASSTGAAQLRYGNSPKLATTSTGIDVTGTATMDGLTVDGASTVDAITYTASSDFPTTGVTLNANGFSYEMVGSQGKVFRSESNTKALMQISGQNDISFYEDTGTTPKLFWDASAESLMLNASTRIGTEILTVNGTVTTGGGTASAPALAFRADSNTGMFRPASQALGFSANGTERLRVSSSGIDVTGTATMDGLTVDGRTDLRGGATPLGVYRTLALGVDTQSEIVLGSQDLSNNYVDAAKIRGLLKANKTDGELSLYTLSSSTLTPRLNIASNGDISFYEDTGTTAKFFWDASAESLGIGNTVASSMNAGANQLVVGSGSTGQGITLYSSTSTAGSIHFADGTSGSEAYRGQLVYNHNGDYMAMYTAATERMRITSSGNVGFNVDPTTSKFRVTHSGVTQLILGYAGGTTNYYDGNLQIFRSSGGSERMRIDSSGNVGIGDSSPASITSDVSTLSLNGTNTGVSGGLAYRVNGSTKAYHYINSGNLLHQALEGTGQRFLTNNTEAMRIDSSGNLLVGTTSAYGTTGTTINAAGLVYSSADGDRAGQFDRTTSDGELVRFSKAGSTVGSIASRAGVVTSLILNPSGSVGAGITEANIGVGPSVSPTNGSGATSDAQVSLGQSSIRFKDLYLSGGVYLGGTGAANKLDDYEEGTWTPVVNSGTATVVNSSYTKVGNIVTVFLRLSLTGTRSSTAFQVSGLPFSIVSGKNSTSPIVAQFYTGGSNHLNTLAIGGTDYFIVQEGGSDALGTEFNNGYFITSFSYPS